MRKILFSLLAVLLLVGVANATEIPGTVEPKNYPTVWTETVYNGSGATIVSAYVVEWDFDVSDSTNNWYDDMCPWVQTASAADSIWTAGVLPYGRDLADGEIGQIIIRGPAYVMAGASGTVNQLIGSEADGQTADAAQTTDNCVLGRTIKAKGHAHGPEVIHGPNYPIVYVDVDCSDM